jgi:hypothetical protein
MNLSSFLFSEFCTLEEHELGRIVYMKDIVLYKGIPTKFISYFLQLYFICYKVTNFRNVYMYRCIDKEVRFIVVFLLKHRWTPVQEKQGATRAWMRSDVECPGGEETKHEAVASMEEDGDDDVRVQWPGSGCDGASVHGGARLGWPA